jgi:hypothetical protein
MEAHDGHAGWAMAIWRYRAAAAADSTHLLPATGTCHELRDLVTQ